ncbi:MAG: hypothetical protein MUE33_01950 [Cytophagaceae bacterium]|nr:hypothetical protein [Cytophagaceae bacterium]
MRQLILTISIYCMQFVTFAQVDKTQYPEFPGGTSAFQQYLIQHLKSDFNIILDKKSEEWYIEFTINEIGQVIDVTILSDQIPISIQTAMKYILLKMPLWSPGVNQEGKPSKFQFILSF